MQKIDLAVWPRAELFRPMAFPFTMHWGIW